MDHVGFIDFGYLKAAAASCLGVNRRKLTPDAKGIVKWVDETGKKLPGDSRFLRLYWYDGAFEANDPRQQEAHSRRYCGADGPTVPPSAHRSLTTPPAG